MSISLVTAPGEYQPAYNPIYFEFSSSNSNQCEFNYVLDLYVNGVFAIRLKTFPNTSGNGVFNIERVLQDYLSYDFNPTAVVFTPKENSIVSYYVEVRERYNTASDCVGDVTLQAVDYTSTTRYVWNGALQYKEFTEYTQGTYPLVASTSSPQTTLPDNLLIGLSDNYTLSVLSEFTFNYMELKTYTANGILIDTYTLTNPYNSAPSPDLAKYRNLAIGVGPRNLNTIVWDGSPVPTQPVIDDTVSYYEITFLVTDSPRDPISVTKTFKIDTRCSKFKNYRLWWLNRLGEFDSYNFNLKHKRKVEVNRNQYTTPFANTYSVGDRGKGVVSVEANEAYTVTSNWMSEDEALWLEELFTSPEVRLYTKTLNETVLELTGLLHNPSGYADFDIVTDTPLEVGTLFTYSAPNGALIGIPTSGSGMITGLSGVYQTNIISTIDPGIGVIENGTVTAEVYTTEHIPVVITSNSYEEKIKHNVKNINYTIDFIPTYNVNVQSL